MKRKIFIMTSFAVSIITGVLFGEAFMQAEKPAEYVGVVFSMLAAALFAVVSIIGDPSMLATGTSAKAWNTARELHRDLQKFYLLFIWYLVTLGLLVMTEVIEYACYDNFYWVADVLVFFATFGFLISLALPSEFSKIQKRRFEQEIKHRISRNGKS